MAATAEPSCSSRRIYGGEGLIREAGGAARGRGGVEKELPGAAARDGEPEGLFRVPNLDFI